MGGGGREERRNFDPALLRCSCCPEHIMLLPRHGTEFRVRAAGVPGLLHPTCSCSLLSCRAALCSWLRRPGAVCGASGRGLEYSGRRPLQSRLSGRPSPRRRPRQLLPLLASQQGVSRPAPANIAAGPGAEEPHHLTPPAARRPAAVDGPRLRLPHPARHLHLQAWLGAALGISHPAVGRALW